MTFQQVSPPKKTKPLLLLGWENTESKHAIGFRPAATESATQATKIVANADIMHQITIAPTGSGKGRGVIIPNLLSYPGPVVVIDPKGENYRVTARARRQMGQRVVCLDPFGCVTSTPDRLNPFDLLDLPNADLESESQTMAEMITGGHTSLKEPFWDLSAKGIVSGVIAYFAACEGKDNRHLNSVRELFCSDDMAYNLAVKMDQIGKKMPRMAYEEMCAFLSMPERETRPSVLATANSYLKPFMSERVGSALHQSTFALEDVVAGKPMTIYVVIPPDKLKSHAGLLRLWIGTLISALLSRTEIPPQKTLFILDEAAQLGSFGLLETILTLCRGYGVACWSFWQDLTQLKRHYSNWQTLLNNCHTWQFFGVRKFQTAKDLHEITGVSPSTIIGLPSDQQIILSDDNPTPKICRKFDYLKDAPFQGFYDENPFYRNFGV
ncbi:MAG: type IV secretory system conjugative DNA transfer family protein [Spirosomaceae bacterium]|jgi:type IV secretion system protein VirD4|nr:type IV secretory system conjugative DNA transfer family protein [Spirosomataceae bacterium]